MSQSSGLVSADLGATQAPALALRGVRRSWGSRTVLAGVDLDLRPGTVAWIGGRNGAGKTTLLRIAAGLITPEAGDISLLGLHPERHRREYQRRLGWLPAGNGGVYNRLSVRQNLEYGVSIALTPRGHSRGAVDTILERFDLERLSRQRTDRISTGERQRLRLAMTFAHAPRLVLLDEPHTSLDENALGLVRNALGQLTASGGAALWCSPSREGIGLPASEGYVVEQGRLIPC